MKLAMKLAMKAGSQVMGLCRVSCNRNAKRILCDRIGPSFRHPRREMLLPARQPLGRRRWPSNGWEFAVGVKFVLAMVEVQLSPLAICPASQLPLQTLKSILLILSH